VALGILETMGYRADVVADGRAALRALADIDYDLVLMDCQMPDLDGYECTRLIRQPATPVLNHRIPIIAMTAHAMAGDREKCLASGMDDYLSKPILPCALQEVLEKWLAGQPVAAVAVPGAEPSRPAIAPAFNGGELLERMMGNEDLARRVVRRFLSDAPQQLANLAEAVSRSDAEAARLAAHSLKGAAANVGGALVSATAKRVEMMGKSGDLTGASQLIPELAGQCGDFRIAAESFWSTRETVE
jgi:CheY-like chemotaxis protein/HPt (histidine-containing phosphotransfer) domain-containing protein